MKQRSQMAIRFDTHVRFVGSRIEGTKQKNLFFWFFAAYEYTVISSSSLPMSLIDIDKKFIEDDSKSYPFFSRDRDLNKLAYSTVRDVIESQLKIEGRPRSYG